MQRARERGHREREREKREDCKEKERERNGEQEEPHSLSSHVNQQSNSMVFKKFTVNTVYSVNIILSRTDSLRLRPSSGKMIRTGTKPETKRE